MTSFEERSSSPKPWQLSPVRVSSTDLASLRLERLANLRVARFDGGINEINTLFVGQKSAFHRIDCNLLKIRQRQAERVRGRFKFFGHRRVTHQTVVGI